MVASRNNNSVISENIFKEALSKGFFVPLDYIYGFPSETD
jgi:hypothetical protein